MPPRVRAITLLAAAFATAPLPVGITTPVRAQIPADLSPGALVAALIDPARPEPERRDAADRLAARLDQTAFLTAAIEAIGDDTPAGARTALVAELARRDTVPPRGLMPALQRALIASRAAPDQAPTTSAVFTLLSRSPTRDAAGVVMDVAMHPDRPVEPRVRADAIAALESITGITSLGADLVRWNEWWSTARWLPESEWRLQVLQAQTARAAMLREANRAAGEELSAVYRRLHAAIAEDARPALLVEMLSSRTTGVRRTAFDLVMVSLLNARPVPNEVAEAATARLTDPVASVRTEAARVVELLSRPEAGPALVAALSRETDPSAAAAMLRAMAKSPTDRGVDLAATWLVRTPESAAAAEQLLLAAMRAGLVIPETSAARVRTALAERPAGSLSPTAIALLLRLGERARVESLLTAEGDATAIAAAQALGENADGVDAVVQAARSRPALFPAAIAALTRHRSTADGLAIAGALADRNVPEQQAAVRAMARSLPVSELRIALAAERDAAQRDALLAAVADSPGFLTEGPDTTERVDLALALVEARLQRGSAADALALLERFPAGWSGPRVLALRIAALVALNRLDDAGTLTDTAPYGGPVIASPWADAWLDGLEWSLQQPTARDLSQRIATRFAGSLSDAQALRLATLTRRLSEESPAADANP